MNGWSIIAMGVNVVGRFCAICDRMIQGALLMCILCLGAAVDLVKSIRICMRTGWLCSYFAPCLQNGRSRSSLAAQREQASTTSAQAGESAQGQVRPQIHQGPSFQEEFKVSITSHNAISIEILDGGICLEGNAADSVRADDPPFTRIQQAIRATVGRSENPIEKLDLFASHFRANLTAPMMASILRVLPPLHHLQLGGLCLPVQELCRTLTHPSLNKLTHLALYDLVFLGNNHTTTEDYHAGTRESTNLALKEIVAVFIRLDDQNVTLDPLLNFLQSAPQLRQFELVMDHSHAYLHGYPRPEQPVVAQQQQQPATVPKVLFSATTFSNLLEATAEHLQLLFLEYTPLTTQHFQAMAQHGKSLAQLRLRDDPDQAGKMQDVQRLKALASLLRCHKSLHTVTLDGLWKHKQESQDIVQVLPHSSTISSLRLRSLPMRLGELRTLLCNNTTLQNLSLHNIAFTVPTLEAMVDEEAVFAVLVQILKKDNSTLRRITWKQAEFRRTEVFPRHRKPKSYRCLHQHQKQQSAQHQLHWYLTLNQRGIRYLMADIDCSTKIFLDLLTKQQTMSQHQNYADQLGQQQPQSETSLSARKGCMDKDSQDGYSLDVVFHMLRNNPSLCR